MSSRTALYEHHCHHGATLTDFAGWEMPLHYGSQLEEHQFVRECAGVFDVSHMRSVDLQGAGCRAFLRYLLANDVAKLATNQALYTVMLTHDGGIIDDLIVYRFSDEEYRLVVNAGTTQKDLAWMSKVASDFDVTIKARDDLSMLAIQGPRAFELLTAHCATPFAQLLPELKRFYAARDNEWLVAYTGYTGERGVEVILPHDDAKALFEQVVRAGIRPIGLGARDTLRLEAGLNLYGQDMDESTHPLESNLAWTIDWKDESRDFIGKDAIQKAKSQAHDRLIALVLAQKGVIRPGMKVLDDSDQVVGTITSGSFSPTCAKGIGLARVHANTAEYFIEMRGKSVPAQTIKLPFVKAGKCNFSLEDISVLG